MLFDACLRTLLAISPSIRRQMMLPRNFDTRKFVNKTLGKKQIHLEKLTETQVDCEKRNCHKE